MGGAWQHAGMLGRPFFFCLAVAAAARAAVGGMPAEPVNKIQILN